MPSLLAKVSLLACRCRAHLRKVVVVLRLRRIPTWSLIILRCVFSLHLGAEVAVVLHLATEAVRSWITDGRRLVILGLLERGSAKLLGLDLRIKLGVLWLGAKRGLLVVLGLALAHHLLEVVLHLDLQELLKVHLWLRAHLETALLRVTSVLRILKHLGELRPASFHDFLECQHKIRIQHRHAHRSVSVNGLGPVLRVEGLPRLSE